RRPWRRARPSLHLRGIPVEPAKDVDCEAAGSHLHSKRAVRVESRRELAAYRDRKRVGNQRAAETHLARSAGDLELNLRLEPERDAVGEPAEDLDAELLFLPALARPLPEDQEAVVLSSRESHRLSRDGEVEKRRV